MKTKEKYNNLQLIRYQVEGAVNALLRASTLTESDTSMFARKMQIEKLRRELLLLNEELDSEMDSLNTDSR